MGSAETELEFNQRTEVMDWSDCPLVEVKHGVQRGRPVLKGTRMPADDIIENWEAGVDEFDIASNFGLPLAQVKSILSYAADHRHAPC
jgi:uncharacterized protein (DUF433 family)